MRPLAWVAAVAIVSTATRLHAQETIVKAEEVIALQAIPLSRPVSFEAQYTEDEIDHLAWIVMRAIDPSNSWNPRHRAWKLYYANIRHNVEEELRRRWQAAAGTIRSLSQNPDTALAKYYSDAFSAAELDEALRFYRSEAGKKYTAYLRELGRTYHRGLIEQQRIAVDPEYGDPGDTATARRQKWIQKRGVRLDPPPPDYQFHVNAAQSIAPNAKPMDVVFAVAAGAPPGTEAFRRLDQLLREADREAILRFLSSTFSEKEKGARKLWIDAITKSRDVGPLIVRDIAGLFDVASRWRKIRAEPNALPRSIVEIDPTTIEVVEQYQTIDLKDGVEPVKTCLPSVPQQVLGRMTGDVNGRSYREMTQTVSNPTDRNIFMARGGVGACIPRTPPGYPIPALNSFVGTVRFGGVGPLEAATWYRAAAQEVAATGASHSLVILSNGNAYEVMFAVNVQSPGMLIYASRFYPAGLFDAAAYRTVHKPTGAPTMTIVGRTTPEGGTRHQRPLLTTPEEIRRDDEMRAKK